MSTFEYFLITLPVLIWYMWRSLGAGLAKAICSVFQQAVGHSGISTPLLDVKSGEVNTLLRILKERANCSVQELRKAPLTFIPKRVRYWYFGSSVDVLCQWQSPKDGQKLQALVNVRCKQRFAVKPWVIEKITQINAS